MRLIGRLISLISSVIIGIVALFILFVLLRGEYAASLALFVPVEIMAVAIYRLGRRLAKGRKTTAMAKPWNRNCRHMTCPNCGGHPPVDPDRSCCAICGTPLRNYLQKT